jgi:glycosyltransferase involved in cell wall biosynthesis
METPLITVLIDTYNYGRYIEEAIESVLAQDFPPEQMQVIVVDDGSTDNTAELVKKYSQIEYMEKMNAGQASALNYGVAHARGQIIAFLDADDYWLPGKLRRVVDEFQKNPGVGLVHHRLKELDTRTGEFRDGFFVPMNGHKPISLQYILSYNPTPTSSLALSRAVTDNIFPMPDAIRIQADGYVQAIAPFVAPIAAINDSLAVYRIHGANLYFLSESGEDKERRTLRAVTMQAIVEGMRAWFDSHGYKKNDSVVRATISRWTSMLERERFATSPPGRIRFFWHLLKSYRYRLRLMSWRLVLVNFFDAAGALIVGWEKFPQWGKRREMLTRYLGRTFKLSKTLQKH